MKKILILSLSILSFSIYAQDVHFSQYNEAPVVLNPALSCVNYNFRAIANYRSQWGSVSSPYKTYGISSEKVINYAKLKKSYFGLSLTVINDKAGDLAMGNLASHLGFNYVLKVSESGKFSAGLGAGLNYKSFSPNKAKWQSQYDGYTYNADLPAGEAITYDSYMQPDFILGVDYSYAKSEKFISALDGTKFNIGGSVSHINTPRNSFYTRPQDKLSTKYVAHTNLELVVKNANFAIMPSAMYVLQGPSQEINVGCMFKYILSRNSIRTDIKKSASLAVGANYRINDAFIPGVLFQWSKYTMGVSYDINLSQLTNVSKTKGGLEFSLRFNTSPGYGKALGNEPAAAQ